MSFDPLNLQTKNNLAIYHFWYRHFDEAIKIAQQILEVDPENDVAVSILGYVCLLQGRYPEALAQFEKWRQLEPESMFLRWGFAWLYARIGERQKARAYLNELLAYNQRRFFAESLIAAIYGELGDKDRAFEFLEKSYARREGGLLTYLKAAPCFDSLRSDPRYKALLRKVGLEK